uniref:Secreted protein n=1 Tax=Peronospora matthiolae TaxID=2874970 RepID=A0AAV1TIG5_9STRA
MRVVVGVLVSAWLLHRQRVRHQEPRPTIRPALGNFVVDEVEVRITRCDDWDESSDLPKANAASRHK